MSIPSSLSSVAGAISTLYALDYLRPPTVVKSDVICFKGVLELVFVATAVCGEFFLGGISISIFNFLFIGPPELPGDYFFFTKLLFACFAPVVETAGFAPPASDFLP